MPCAKSTMPRQFGPHNAIPAAPGGGGDALLRRLPLAPGLAEAGGEYDGTAHATTGAGRDGGLDGDARQEQHGGVDAVGQIIDGAQAGAITDVGLVPADQVDGAAVVELFEIPQRQEFRRARLGEMPRSRSIAASSAAKFDRRDRGHGRRSLPHCFFRSWLEPRPIGLSSRNWVRPSLRPFSSS